jgi:protein SCO1/2
MYIGTSPVKYGDFYQTGGAFILTQKKNNQLYILMSVAIMLLVVIAYMAVNFYTGWKEANKLPEIMSAPTFTLETTTGEGYNSDNGKVKLVTFFFTNCPDICPMTLVDFQDIQQTLKDEGLFADKVELLAITLDPERDDIKTLQQYSKGFGPDPSGWHFLRGSDEEIKILMEQLKYSFFKDESGFVNHPTSMYMIDQNNVVRSLHKMTTPTESLNQEVIISNIKKLISEGKE